MAIGLDIGSSGLRAVEVARHRSSGEFRLVRAASADLPTGVVVNGAFEDPAAMTKALRRIWRTAGFRSRKVAFGLAETTILTRQVDLPWMPPEDFQAALRYQVQDALPVDVRSSELAYHLLEEVVRVDASGQQAEINRILVLAADRDAIAEQAQVLRRAGLEPVAADSSAFALIRAWCRGRMPADEATHAIADIGADQLTVVVHAHGQPRFIRSVANLGGRTATEAIARALDLDLGDAEELKRRTGLNGPAPVVVPVAESSVFASSIASPTLPTDPRIAQAVATLGPWATTVVQEIRNSIDYFHATADGQMIASLTLAGRTVQLTGLVERIATQLPYPVRQFEPLLGLKASSRVSRNAPDDARLAVAAGLAMRSCGGQA
jgi:type IV pilus assembly protein PilM